MVARKREPMPGEREVDVHALGRRDRQEVAMLH